MKGRPKKTLAVAGLLVLLGLIAGCLWRAGFPAPGLRLEKVTVSTIPSRNSGLFYLARARGF